LKILKGLAIVKYIEEVLAYQETVRKGQIPDEAQLCPLGSGLLRSSGSFCYWESRHSQCSWWSFTAASKY